VTEQDRLRWDERYRDASHSSPRLPACFEHHADLVANCSTALELACGTGQASVWLAQQGTHVAGFDISPVAIAQAQALAAAEGVAGRCTFAAADLDEGLPVGDQVDLVLCNRFRDERLDQQVIDRLRPNGILALAALSEVGAEPGRFRVKSGELLQAFRELTVIDSHEADGLAWIIGRKVHL